MRNGPAILRSLPALARMPRPSAKPPVRRRNRRSNAKSAVLSAVGVLFGLTIGLGLFVNAGGIRDPMFEVPANQFRERVKSPQDAVKIVFLGSSRTGNGIRPRIAEEEIVAATGTTCVAQNLHVPAVGPIGELVYWRRLLQAGCRPDVLVVELCPPWLASQPNGEPMEAASFAGDRMTHDELALVQKYGFPKSVESEWREANANPWFGFRFQILGRIQPNWLPPNVANHQPQSRAEYGWRQPYFLDQPTSQQQLAAERNRAEFKPMIEQLTDRGPAAQALRDLVSECVSQGVAVAVWVTPEAARMREWYTRRSEDRLQTLLAELQSLGAIAVDGRAWLPDEAFADGHHCVRSWSNEYTRAVTRKAVVPALNKLTR